MSGRFERAGKLRTSGVLSAGACLFLSLIAGALVFGSAGIGTNASASSPHQDFPICSIKNFFISGKQSDGGMGSNDTYVYFTNNGSTCRLVPIGARGYDLASHSFIGTPAQITKPDVRLGNLWPYATTHLLGTVDYGQSVSLDLRYADVDLGALRNCGRTGTATAMAFWVARRPSVIKVVRLVFGLRGGLSTLTTCSQAQYLYIFWPSTGPFWFVK